jgi:cytochrome c553
MAALSALAALLFVAASGVAGAEEVTSCVGCHGNPEIFDGQMLAIVEQWRGGVHSEVQIGCQDCHGGNPDPALAEDSDAAMDRRFEPNPYVGSPERQAIPAFCGRCHSDPKFMKRYNPAARVDQVREYWTSHHGRALAGDTRVACITAASTDPPRRRHAVAVYPKQVAETCGRCHSDSQRMAGSTTPDGRPLPVDQQARWRRSVHAAALFERDDLSAPTCNDCHGNHGATPPGLDSIAFVCGQCRPRGGRVSDE